MSKRLNLSVQYALADASEVYLPERALIRSWVRAALNLVDGLGGQITVRFVSNEEGRCLNRDYRQKDYTTNVLSFPYEFEPAICGDLVIAPVVCATEATQQGKTGEAHMAHLLLHGTLHLMGYDHEGEAAAEEMEQIERELMSSLGYPDPYAD